ncbi:MAG TPA: hypothetical protein VFK78_07290 [Gemmatimonadales bacterium]|nr:hypothetical protein [Gemmatimonadales bacterium]
MFKQILYTQWKWSRLTLLLLAVVGFAIPVLSVRDFGDPSAGIWEVRDALDSVAAWGYAYPILAAAVALLLSVTTWGPDHQGRHVYALSLPVPRWHYALLRFSAGVVLIGLVVAAVWIGALVASASASAPPGLHAYPQALALRFALATVVAYSIFFAIAAGTNRTAGVILVLIIAIFVIEVVSLLAGIEATPTSFVLSHLVVWPGPLAIFTGRWMLIDV